MIDCYFENVIIAIYVFAKKEMSTTSQPSLENLFIAFSIFSLSFSEDQFSDIRTTLYCFPMI